MRRQQGDCDKPTASAIPAAEREASSCNAARIFLSILSIPATTGPALLLRGILSESAGSFFAECAPPAGLCACSTQAPGVAPGLFSGRHYQLALVRVHDIQLHEFRGH